MDPWTLSLASDVVSGYLRHQFRSEYFSDRSEISEPDRNCPLARSVETEMLVWCCYYSLVPHSHKVSPGCSSRTRKMEDQEDLKTETRPTQPAGWETGQTVTTRQYSCLRQSVSQSVSYHTLRPHVDILPTWENICGTKEGSVSRCQGLDRR